PLVAMYKKRQDIKELWNIRPEWKGGRDIATLKCGQISYGSLELRIWCPKIFYFVCFRYN
ncbi:MAG: hypothetical protein ACE5I5_20720, partial [Candidatus Heimdallarchaeota archaeon]